MVFPFIFLITFVSNNFSLKFYSIYQQCMNNSLPHLSLLPLAEDCKYYCLYFCKYSNSMYMCHQVYILYCKIYIKNLNIVKKKQIFYKILCLYYCVHHKFLYYILLVICKT